MKKNFMYVLSVIFMSMAVASGSISNEKKAELVKEKEYVYKQEIKKIQRLLKVKEKKNSMAKSLFSKRVKCDDNNDSSVDVDIDIDVIHSEEEVEDTPHAYCNNRYSNGTCASYGSDVMTDEVSSNCVNRYSNGTCASYGSDHVGGTCYPNCINRYSNGTCASYGADICD